MLVEIVVPDSLMPKKDPEHPCPCQFREFKMQDKQGELFWLVEVGETVHKGQVICEGEVEKKTLEFTAPCDGILKDKCIDDEEFFYYGDVLGHIEA